MDKNKYTVQEEAKYQKEAKGCRQTTGCMVTIVGFMVFFAGNSNSNESLVSILTIAGTILIIFGIIKFIANSPKGGSGGGGGGGGCGGSGGGGCGGGCGG